MLSRASFPTSPFRRAYETKSRLPAHGGSSPLSNLHRLAPGSPSLPCITGNATRRPLLLNTTPLAEPQRARRASLSLWPSGSAKPVEQRVSEAYHRYSKLNDRELLLLYLDKQDEAWGKHSSRVPMPSWADYARWVTNGGALLYLFYYIAPSIAAAGEKAVKKTALNWNTMTTTQRHIYNKVVEIEKRLDKESGMAPQGTGGADVEEKTIAD